MSERAEREQLDRVRERFTRTAQEFSSCALGMRGEEAELLASLVAPRGDDVAMDLACGPGTFTRAIAARARFVLGLDLTPAMLAEARQAASRAALANIGFACGDGNALPLADSSLGIVTCGYAFHHMHEPGRVFRELVRVLRPGGRLAFVDMIVPDGADAGATNRIERTRDSSHATTLTRAQLHALVEAAGLRLLHSQIGTRPRKFDGWMQSIGCPLGSADYVETRRLMEASIPGDSAGYQPRFVSNESGQQELQFVQTSLMVVGEKR